MEQDGNLFKVTFLLDKGILVSIYSVLLENLIS